MTVAESPFSDDLEYLKGIADDAVREPFGARLMRLAAELDASLQSQIDYLADDPWEGIDYDRYLSTDDDGKTVFLREDAIEAVRVRLRYRHDGGNGAVLHRGTWVRRVGELSALAYVRHCVYRFVTDIPHRASMVENAVRYAAEPPPSIGREYVGFANGDLRLSDLQLVPAHPDHGVWARVSADWDPQATCPAFDAYIDHHVVAEDHLMLWAMIASALVPWLPADVAFWLFGDPRTGKNTIIERVQALMTSWAAVINLSSYAGDRFAAAAIVGATVAIDEDADLAFVEGSNAIKRATSSKGRERIEDKGVTATSAERTATIVMASNGSPRFDDPALATRLRLIRMRNENSFLDREDPNASRPLETPEEMAGIARRAVLEGLLPLLDGSSCAFVSNAALVQQVRAAGNTSAGWLQALADDQYNGHHPPAGTELRVSYLEFRLWCAENGERVTPSARRWHGDLEAHLTAFGWTSAAAARWKEKFDPGPGGGKPYWRDVKGVELTA